MNFLIAVALAWLAFIFVRLPLRSRANRLKRTTVRPSRLQFYRKVGLGLWGMTLVTALLDWPLRFGWPRLLRVPVPAELLGWTLALTAAILVFASVVRAWRVAHARQETPFLQWFLPVTPEEQRRFTVLGISAGVTEEYIYRGFALALLTQVTGSVPLAVVIVTLAFGFAHGYQSWLGIVRSCGIGLLAAIPVLVTGSLWPSILAHALVDVVAGFVLQPTRGRRATPAPAVTG